MFKNKELTLTKVKNNILSVWNETTLKERHDWYSSANEYCLRLCEEFKLPLAKVVGVVAALSPLRTWEQNKVIAKEFIATGDCGHVRVFKNKAADIMVNGCTPDEVLLILNGNKIKSFFTNIHYPDKLDEVTIDRHAISIALGRKASNTELRGITDKQYEFFVEAYKAAAAKVGTTPSLMQSATWVHYRKK